MVIWGHFTSNIAGPQEKPALLIIIIAKLIDLISWFVTEPLKFVYGEIRYCRCSRIG
jgi:hypothetical protein